MGEPHPRDGLVTNISGPVGRLAASLRSTLGRLLPSKADRDVFSTTSRPSTTTRTVPSSVAEHPAALGAPIREVLGRALAGQLPALFDSVLRTGEAFWAQDLPFFPERHGYPEETYDVGHPHARRVRARERRLLHRQRDDPARGR